MEKHAALHGKTKGSILTQEEAVESKYWLISALITYPEAKHHRLSKRIIVNMRRILPPALGIVMAMLVSACQTTNGNKVATPEERVQIAEVFHGKAAETESQCRDSKAHLNPPGFGLDSLGGVHYLLEVDMSSAIIRRLEGIVDDLRGLVRDNSQLLKENVRTTITRDGDTVVLRFSSAAQRTTARAEIQSFTGEL
ncbi:MAG: hypothetical protein LBF16_05950, partial [Pseudomonadales bacterium]|nr:hypothetical protein [Pseudomonadales bacterium]